MREICLDVSCAQKMNGGKKKNGRFVNTNSGHGVEFGMGMWYHVA